VTTGLTSNTLASTRFDQSAHLSSRGQHTVCAPRVQGAEPVQPLFSPSRSRRPAPWSGQEDGGQPFVAGVYPMLQDETCFFLAVDFDKQHPRDDTAAFLVTCRLLDVPAALERSRSGRGGHVWLFFEDAVPATLARRLGAHVLIETMERRPDLPRRAARRDRPDWRRAAKADRPS